MSRIGKAPIAIPQGAKVTLTDAAVEIEGPLGKLKQPMHPGIEIEIEDNVITLKRGGDSGPERSRHGLVRSLLANAVAGVTTGFKKELLVIGVGYRGEVQGRDLHLSLGFSHPVVYPIPEGIEIEIDRQNKITVSGYDKQQVGQVAAEIRSLRKPDAYKGKGIRYADERLKLKVGKAGAGA